MRSRYPTVKMEFGATDGRESGLKGRAFNAIFCHHGKAELGWPPGEGAAWVGASNGGLEMDSGGLVGGASGGCWG